MVDCCGKSLCSERKHVNRRKPIDGTGCHSNWQNEMPIRLRYPNKLCCQIHWFISGCDSIRFNLKEVLTPMPIPINDCDYIFSKINEYDTKYSAAVGKRQSKLINIQFIQRTAEREKRENFKSSEELKNVIPARKNGKCYFFTTDWRFLAIYWKINNKRGRGNLPDGNAFRNEIINTITNYRFNFQRVTTENGEKKTTLFCKLDFNFHQNGYGYITDQPTDRTCSNDEMIYQPK